MLGAMELKIPFDFAKIKSFENAKNDKFCIFLKGCFIYIFL